MRQPCSLSDTVAIAAESDQSRTVLDPQTRDCSVVTLGLNRGTSILVLKIVLIVPTNLYISKEHPRSCISKYNLYNELSQFLKEPVLRVRFIM